MVAVMPRAILAIRKPIQTIDLFNNPYSWVSAHHRPMGTDAEYASSSHAMSVAFRAVNTGNINCDNGWGTNVYVNSSSDPLRDVTWNGVGTGGGLPLINIRTPFMRNPESGSETTDSQIILYNAAGDGLFYEFYRWQWNNGAPKASFVTKWDGRGPGHENGKWMGTSTSGITGLVGLNRGHELNPINPAPIQHVMQCARQSIASPQQMGKGIVWPASFRDGFCSQAQYCTGAIPYGQLFAIPTDTDINQLRTPGGVLFNARQKAVAAQTRDYGVYCIDNGDGAPTRCDQYLNAAARIDLKNALLTLFPLCVAILNSVEGQIASGGGFPIAPNSAFDAP